MIESRAITWPMPTHRPQWVRYLYGQKCMALVPNFDMFNHDIDPNVSYGRLSNNDVFVRTKRSIKSGEECLNNYGEHASVNVLSSLKYGFTSNSSVSNTYNTLMEFPFWDIACAAVFRTIEKCEFLAKV